MPLTDAQIERYSRQIIVPGIGGRAQERLLGAKMLLAGELHDIEQPLAYLVGAGVGSIRLALADNSDRLKKSDHLDKMRVLNPDVTIDLGSVLDIDSPNRFDLAMLLIGDDALRDLAATLADRIDATAYVIARLDDPSRLAILAAASSCPRCADASLLAQSVSNHSASADFVAMLATTESLKLLAGYSENPSSVIIDFEGYATRPHPVTSACTCGAHDRSVPSS
ncbi:MAG: ThiF family adenylyltransferase [Candidatus Binatus sp.]|uniref:HesA/MoeB/ThiF family protein n=1 Tax=Candidatus Binatus sp. TaxID=2811406 RepID=UPI002724136B|nr:ThiF family adenylyltransferase [Candidatus Binatus sp.]MDO8434654.1 ThiF family adenylyltransferase [Candidatus Binatus sp.]